jgi:hypothetical protein
VKVPEITIFGLLPSKKEGKFTRSAPPEVTSLGVLQCYFKLETPLKAIATLKISYDNMCPLNNPEVSSNEFSYCSVNAYNDMNESGDMDLLNLQT